MCGVVGYSCKKPRKKHYDLLQRLIRESKIRGTHSYGFSFCDGGLQTIKKHKIDDVEFPQTNKIIYHNRYSTSGDYKDHQNNQPIHLESCALVFNGVLDMRTKSEIEKDYGINMQTENDGEIVLQTCGDDPSKIKQYISETKGSFAGLILTAENKMYAIRNQNRPLWMLLHEGATFYASTRNIFQRVCGSFEPVELKPNQIYES